MACSTHDNPMGNMVAVALLTAIFCTPASTVVGGSISLESPAAGGRITVDGDPSDWDGFPTVYLEDSLRVVAASHDDDHLYLMYRFGDERLAERLLQRGVILWINGDGKTKNKDEAFGIRYTGSEVIGEFFKASNPDDKTGTEPDEADLRKRPRGMDRLAEHRPDPGKLTVIRYGVKDVIPEGLPLGPNAASAIHDGVFCYEFRIPLAEIGGKVADQKPSKKRKIAVGIQIGGTTDAERENIEVAIQDSLGRGGGPPSGDAGGMGGGGRGGMGGMGGGGRSGPPRDRDEIKKRLDPEIQWLNIQLDPSP